MEPQGAPDGDAADEAFVAAVRAAAHSDIFVECLQMVVAQEDVRFSQLARELLALYPAEIRNARVEDVLSGTGTWNLSDETRKQMLWLLAETDDYEGALPVEGTSCPAAADGQGSAGAENEGRENVARQVGGVCK